MARIKPLLLFSIFVLLAASAADTRALAQDSGTMTIRVLMVYQTVNGFDRVPERVWNGDL